MVAVGVDVNPARAGMILFGVQIVFGGNRKPRASGDDPVDGIDGERTWK